MADDVVLTESKYIIFFVLILSVLMQVVFVALEKWNYAVLFGNIIGGLAAILNFFIMGITVQSAVNDEAKNAKSKIKISQMLRTIMLFAVVCIGCIVTRINVAALLISLFFPRIAIQLRPMFKISERG